MASFLKYSTFHWVHAARSCVDIVESACMVGIVDQINFNDVFGVRQVQVL